MTVVQLTIASEKRWACGSCVMEVYLVKGDGRTSWEYFYDNIKGFEWEKGYEYVLEVRKEQVPNPPACGSSIRYFLVKEISKTNKTSEDMPGNIVPPPS